jgi:light-regulated signal transduction histidine kinase (bacteriophytochrome)
MPFGTGMSSWAQDTFDTERRIVETGLPEIDKVEQIRKPDGRFGWFSTTKVPILGGGVQVSGIVAISRDITERKEASEKLAQQTQQLERQNTELERFAYVAAHHLSHARMTLRPLIPVPTDCERVCQQALDELQTAIEQSGARVTWDPLPIIVADELQLAQLFANLIANAIKFRGETPPRIHVSAERKDGEWLFSVHNNGIGIDPQYTRQIFEIFQRLHVQSEYPGTGIGLALCQKIVEGFHGRIWVESELGKGAKFCFTVPEDPLGPSL